MPGIPQDCDAHQDIEDLHLDPFLGFVQCSNQQGEGRFRRGGQVGVLVAESPPQPVTDLQGLRLVTEHQQLQVHGHGLGIARIAIYDHSTASISWASDSLRAVMPGECAGSVGVSSRCSEKLSPVLLGFLRSRKERRDWRKRPIRGLRRALDPRIALAGKGLEVSLIERV
jgi:hypothetical protein